MIAITTTRRKAVTKSKNVSATQRTAVEKAQRNGRWAETMFRALTRRVGKRWQFISFRGKQGSESRGVVDLVAMRRSSVMPATPGLKAGDLFDIILVQLKGGGARMPSPEDARRLRQVARRYHARRVVLYSWKKGSHSTYRVLATHGVWQKVTPTEAFA